MMNINNRKLTAKSRSSHASFRLFLSVCLLSIFSGGATWAAQPIITDSKAEVTVYKTKFCGCCSKWTKHLEHSGLRVNIIVVEDTRLVRARLGEPRELASCHTAVGGDYWIEGHVPVDLVSRLLEEQPANIKGIAVPGMPPGVPGMDIPNAPAHKVLSVDSAGEVGLYATRRGSSSR